MGHAGFISSSVGIVVVGVITGFIMADSPGLAPRQQDFLLKMTAWGLGFL